jgi:hypothetical protein
MAAWVLSTPTVATAYGSVSSRTLQLSATHPLQIPRTLSVSRAAVAWVGFANGKRQRRSANENYEKLPLFQNL